MTEDIEVLVTVAHTVRLSRVEWECGSYEAVAERLNDLQSTGDLVIETSAVTIVAARCDCGQHPEGCHCEMERLRRSGWTDDQEQEQAA